MSAQFSLRDRSDGQFEIVFARPVLVGIFPDRDVAEKVMMFLSEDEHPDLEIIPPVHCAAEADDLSDPIEDLAKVEERAVRKLASLAPRTKAPARAKSSLPAVIPEKPRQAVQLVIPPLTILTEAQREEAFTRIRNGEKVGKIAPEYGVSMGQLRSAWAVECRNLQKHLAQGGQQRCMTCQKPFTPSISSPDHCARCNHD